MTEITAVDVRIPQTGYSNITYSNIALLLKRSLKVGDQKLITNLIIKEEYKLASRCNRQFAYSSKVYYDTVDAGFSIFKPSTYPLSTLTKVLVDGVDKTSLYTENTNYWIKDRQIRFLVPIVSSSYAYNAVRLEYTIRQFWGYDVIDYLSKAVAVEFLASENAGVKLSNTSFADTSLTFDLNSFKSEQEDLIYRYSKPVI